VNKMQKENIEASVDAFAARFAATDADKKLSVLAHCVDLLRHVSGEESVTAAAELLQKIGSYPWAKLNFSVADVLLSATCRDRVRARGVPDDKVSQVIFAALSVFMDAIESDEATAATLLNVLDEIADVSVPSPPPVSGPIIFSASTLAPVFTAPTLTPALAEEIGFCVCFFRAAVADPVNSHVLGPEVRGFSFSANGQHLILLESGEVLCVPYGYPHIWFSTAREDLQFVSAVLPALTCANVESLHAAGALSTRAYDAIRAGKMGKFLVPCTHARLPANELAELEEAFDKCYQSVSIGAVGATSPIGAVKRFPIPGENFTLRVVLQPATNGPYVLAQLLRDENDTVVMRHDTPRLYAARGAYLFPLSARVISFTIF